jgi:hypothetical protein
MSLLPPAALPSSRVLLPSQPRKRPVLQEERAGVVEVLGREAAGAGELRRGWIGCTESR